MYRLLGIVAILIGLNGTWSTPALGETYVTTYVTRVQEERRSTRFTLTEWLKIKERMKLMDLYMAMFSNPQKDHFSPELNLNFGMTQGAMGIKNEDQTFDQTGDLDSRFGKAQLWLTNLISSTVKVRTLNIDFGVEGYVRESGNFTQEETAAGTDEVTRRHLVRYYGGNFRIFGRNIQDSSIVLKIGNYDVGNSVFRTTEATPQLSHKGIYAGGELQLYLFRWLGLEGNYLHYGSSDRTLTQGPTSGSYYDYMAYIEISLVRFMAGMYSESWDLSHDSGKYTTEEAGPIAGVKAQF